MSKEPLRAGSLCPKRRKKPALGAVAEKEAVTAGRGPDKSCQSLSRRIIWVTVCWRLWRVVASSMAFSVLMGRWRMGK